MRLRHLFFLALPAVLCAQELLPTKLLEQPTDAWPTYNGDYSGRRFSPLTEINSSNVHTLSLAWATRLAPVAAQALEAAASASSPRR